MASNAPLLLGVLTGIVGGILVGLVSQSHTSVSGLAAIVAAQIVTLGSFPAFLMAYSDRGNARRKLGKLDEALQIDPQFAPAWEACAAATWPGA